MASSFGCTLDRERKEYSQGYFVILQKSAEDIVGQKTEGPNRKKGK